MSDKGQFGKQAFLRPLLSTFLHNHPASLTGNLSNRSFFTTAPAVSLYTNAEEPSTPALSPDSNNLSFPLNSVTFSSPNQSIPCHHYTTSEISAQNVLPSHHHFLSFQPTSPSTSTPVILQTHGALLFIDPNHFFSLPLPYSLIFLLCCLDFLSNVIHTSLKTTLTSLPLFFFIVLTWQSLSFGQTQLSS